jgi:hypothetical protein
VLANLGKHFWARKHIARWHKGKHARFSLFATKWYNLLWFLFSRSILYLEVYFIVFEKVWNWSCGSWSRLLIYWFKHLTVILVASPISSKQVAPFAGGVVAQDCYDHIFILDFRVVHFEFQKCWINWSSTRVRQNVEGVFPLLSETNFSANFRRIWTQENISAISKLRKECDRVKEVDAISSVQLN